MADKLTEQLQQGGERTADTITANAQTLTQQIIQPEARQLAEQVCCFRFVAVPRLASCGYLCKCWAPVASTLLWSRGGADAVNAGHHFCAQAQPTADEVKEEIIQPLADKVKAEAVPAAERLTREQLQPAAEQAAKQLDAGAQQLTEEVMKPAAEVGALKPTAHLLKCPLDRYGAVHVSVRLVLPHAWNAVL